MCTYDTQTIIHDTFFFFQFMLVTSISIWFLFLLHLLLLLSLFPPQQFSLFSLRIVPLIILLCLCYYTCTCEWEIYNILLLSSQGLSISCHGDTDKYLRWGFSLLLRLVAMSSHDELGRRLILSTVLLSPYSYSQCLCSCLEILMLLTIILDF